MTKRPFTSGSEGDLLACTFFRRDWVGVKCTAIFLQIQVKRVQDRKECEVSKTSRLSDVLNKRSPLRRDEFV